jgi:phosphatidylglycerol:prolipoprotein diacylglycerol transferase
MTWVHDLSPFAIQFTQTFGIRWYGLAYLSGFISGYYALLWIHRRGGTQFKVDEIPDFITYTAIGVLAGGRLGYCLFYAPELFTSLDSHFPYWGVLKVNEGGMASHGGILGVMLLVYIWSKRHKMSFWHCLDLTTFGSSIGFMFGRLANFVNGELYGREAPTGWWGAMKFPQEMSLWLQKDFGKMPSLAQTAEALGQIKTDSGEIIPVNSATWLSWVENYSRDFASRQHVHETVENIIQAVQAHNTKVIDALGMVLTPRYPSQLYQAVLEGLLVFLALVWVWRKPQKPGVIAACFGVFYCIARIIGEQYRMPDVQIGFQLFGLTRGQWISIVLLIVALIFLILNLLKKAPKMAGWGAEAVALRVSHSNGTGDAVNSKSSGKKRKK